MQVEVKYFGNFWNITNKKRENIDISPNITLKDVMEKLTSKYNFGFREVLYTLTGENKPFNLVLVNGKNVRELLGMKTKIKSDDKIALLYLAGGG